MPNMNSAMFHSYRWQIAAAVQAVRIDGRLRLPCRLCGYVGGRAGRPQISPWGHEGRHASRPPA